MVKAEDGTRKTNVDSRLLLEQYKLLVGSAEKISELRQKMNAFYLSINSLIIGLSGYLSISATILGILGSVLGVLIAFIWGKNIESYRQLNSAKFKVITEMEEKLPFAMYKKEYFLINKKHKTLTSVEKKIPWAFILLYLVIFVLSVCRL